MEFSMTEYAGQDTASVDAGTPQMVKFFAIYMDFYRKFGRQWAQKVQQFDKRNRLPFAQVNREVNTAMRRYLGADGFARCIDTLEYMILREGVLVKDARNNLDICERTFNEWLV